ncbi:MAG: ectoine hydroxylase [Alphaproteobacteria bacterium]
MTSMTDVYPSRFADRPSITERRDPVIHANEEDVTRGPLSHEQVSDYERQGFLSFPKFLSEEEVAALSADMEALWRDAADSSDETIIREPDSDTVRSIFAIHESHPTFRRLARDPRLVAIAEQLLGSPVYVHQSRFNYKTGFCGKEFYWHSDFETWHIEDGMPRMRAVSFSISLTENLPLNGPLMLIPGSHKHYVACVGETPPDHHKESLRRQEYGVPDPDSLTWLVERGGGIAAPTGPAGSLVLFECNTMHGSNGNITPFPRSNIFFVYNSVENALTSPFGAAKPRPKHIASRDFKAVEPG